jgi:hypothetical protein
MTAAHAPPTRTSPAPWTLTAARVREIIAELARRGYGDDIQWAETCAPPVDADKFARELVFVICNSGMKNTVARGIFERVVDALEGDQRRPVIEVFKHPGKAAAIDRIWHDRSTLFAIFNACKTDQARIDFLGGLPWIGEVTKFHAARNFGVDCVKPDIHLQRIADHHGVTPHQLCARLAAELGLRIGTMDAVLWRAGEQRVIDTLALARAAL